MRRDANWWAWSLHGIFGLIVGALGGVYCLSRDRTSRWLEDPLTLPFLIGTALIGAGLGSRYGDRLWLGDNYRILPPHEPEQSNLSDWLSWCLVAAGVATSALALLKHFHVL